MSSFFRFLRHHAVTLIIVAVCVVGAVWIVKTQRAPGSMTIVEAQAMDMTTSKPPDGVQPVGVEAVALREIGSSESYPATLEALSDEDVVARVPGRVSKVLVYNGDSVRPGRLLATIEASEYSSQANEAQLMASSKLAMATSAMRDIREREAMLRKSESMITASTSNLSKMQSELDAMKAERKKAEAEQSMSQADVREREADAQYAAKDLEREKKLYNAGAISLDELQVSTKEQDGAQARLRAARAKANASSQEIDIADKRIAGAKAGVAEARAMIASAKAERDQSRASVSKAKQDAKAAKWEAQSSKAAASGMGAISDYRNLRASSAGVVSERVVSPGSVVMAGQTILRIKAIDHLRVQADLPQSLFGKIAVGSKVVVNTESVSREALVTSINPSVNAETRTFQVEAMLNNADHKMAPGMFAKLKLHMGESAQKLAVKSVAVHVDADGNHYVWTVIEKAGDGKATDWTCTMHPLISEKGPGLCPICKMDLVPRSRSGKFSTERKSVTIGATDGTYTAILTGLKEGDKVIWAGFESLHPGLAVQETPWGENGPLDLPSTGSGDMKDMPGMPAPKTEKGPSDEGRGTSRPQSAPKDDMKDMPGMPAPKTEKGTSEKPKAKTVATKWICPMKCKGSESDKPGTCPVCKMDLVKVKV